MQQSIRICLRAVVGTAIYALAMHASWAQDLVAGSGAQAGDPARWYQENTTPRARMKSLKKEAAAAYQEARTECRTVARSMRTACLKEARTIFEQTLADAKQEARASRR